MGEFLRNNFSEPISLLFYMVFLIIVAIFHFKKSLKNNSILSCTNLYIIFFYIFIALAPIGYVLFEKNFKYYYNTIFVFSFSLILFIIGSDFIVKNKNNIEIVTEKALHTLILEDIESFMKELGNSFSFIGSEYKILLGNTYNYIDLLLFNIDFNCYVVIELKITELQKEHIGQIEIYMNYIDNNLRKYNQDKTIGIIITRKNNKFIMEYCSDKRIMFKEYSVVS